MHRYRIHIAFSNVQAWMHQDCWTPLSICVMFIHSCINTVILMHVQSNVHVKCIKIIAPLYEGMKLYYCFHAVFLLHIYFTMPTNGSPTFLLAIHASKSLWESCEWWGSWRFFLLNPQSKNQNILLKNWTPRYEIMYT